MPRKLKTIEIERISVEQFHEAEKTPLVVVLDNVRSMYNIGSVFRTADAFRIEEVLLCGITATPPSNEIHKTALGAEESVAWQYFKETTDAVAYLKEKGYMLCAIEQCEGSVMLNDFKNITDSTNISFGNPNLSPEYSQSFELNYMKTWENHVLSVSSYYRHSDDIMQHISYMDGGIMYSTHVNVAASNSAGFEIVGKDRFFNCLDLTSTINLYYYQQEGFAYQYTNHETGRIYDVTGNPTSSFSWNARVIASLTLPHSWSGQLTSMYHSGRANAQGYSKAGYGIDCGIRKQFMDNKWSIALNARDLLDSRAWRNVTFGDDFYMESVGRRGGRRIMCVVTYNFGNMKAKKKGPQDGEEGGEMGGHDDHDDMGGGFGDFGE